MVLNLKRVDTGECESRDAVDHSSKSQLSLHEIVRTCGEVGAVTNLAPRVRGRRAISDVLTGRRGRRILRVAKEHLDDKSHAEEARSFVYSAWCHASFPHKPPATNEETWTVQTDSVTLRVDPGRRTDDGGVNFAVGLPYGAYARLLCIDWSSQAFNTQSREIELGRNLGDTMTRLGLLGGGKTRSRLLEQAERLARCRLTFDIRGKGKSALINQTIVDTAIFNESSRKGRFVERIRLSETFFQQLMQYPVAIDPLSIRGIRNSPMAIDIYCWLAYRLLGVSAETHISWNALKAQFGVGYASIRNFKTQFSESLLLAKGVYIGARADLTEHGIRLNSSPPPTTPAKPIRARPVTPRLL
jgi:hypothetical protein